MKETIRFKGLTLNRDEMGIEHGEMSLCGNVELHDGALRASVLDGTQQADGDDLPGRLVYVHETASYKNYISVYYSYVVEGVATDEYYWREGDINNSIMWYSSAVYDDNLQRLRWESRHINASWPGMPTNNNEWNLYNAGRIRSINSVGNTLILLTDTGLHYFHCEIITAYGVNPTTTRYKYLGQQPPFLELQFNLARDSFDQVYKHYRLPWNMDTLEDWGNCYDHNEGDPKYYIKEEYVGDITDMVMANVNFITDQIAGGGGFYGPFLIRYAYRLYDGTSLIMHSPPVMMMPMLKHPVRNFANAINLMYVYAMECKLQSRCLNRLVIDRLKGWRDIVKSVDIFITPQKSRINSAGKVETLSVFDPDSASDTYLNDDYSLIDGSMQDIVSEYKTLYDSHLFPADEWIHIDIPEYEEKDFLSSITNASTFFKLTSINTEDLDNVYYNDGFHDLKFDSYVLRNITTQQQMTDDYKTHNLLLPATAEVGGMSVYNHRLNVYGISERLFKGFSPNVLFPYSLPADSVSITQYDVWVNTDYGLRRMTTTGSWSALLWLLTKGYCFYPDSRAVRMSFSAGGSNRYRTMEQAPELNGALSFLPQNSPSSYTDTSIADDVVPLTNKIYTSRADNPFYFPNLPGESGINTLGVGNIIGLAVPMRSLTDDNAGFNDLVAFCTDGIWTAKVSSTGTYSEKHNIEGEVCINKDSICQLDQSVIFATDRSLSRYAGQNVVSITDVLDGPFFDVETKLPGLVAYLTQQSLTDVLRLVAFDTAPDVYYREGKVFYDYLGSRIIVFRKDLSAASIALVFSIRDQAWSTMDIPPLRAVLNSYPTPYIQDASGVVTRFDTPYDHDSLTLHNSIVVTRTLSYSDTMDLIRGFRQMTDASHMPLLLFYGSNDQRSWQEIGRSARSFHNYIPGHPFRFFRVAIVMQMLTAERYQELELEIVNKYAKL